MLNLFWHCRQLLLVAAEPHWKGLYMISVSQRLLESLKKHGANFFATVPCKLSADFVYLISQDKEIIHVAPTREEEGVGICAGAYLSGKMPVMVIQNRVTNSSSCNIAGKRLLPDALGNPHPADRGLKQ